MLRLNVVTAAAVVAKTHSGARVVKILGQDGKFYWVKFAHSHHGKEAVAFEVITTALGWKLGAPVPRAALVQVPSELATQTDSDGVRLGTSLGFGSEHISGYEVDEPDFATMDGNPSGLPRLLALTELCMGSDEQFIVDPANDSQVRGFDFGFWLAGDHPGWNPMWVDDPTESYIDEAWEELPLSLDGLLDARNRVTALTTRDFIEAVSLVPPEWGMNVGDLHFVAYSLERRKTRTIDTIDHFIGKARAG